MQGGVILVLIVTVIAGRCDPGVNRDLLQGGVILVLIATVIAGRCNPDVKNNYHCREV